jgi:sugar phosphate isomerase/epimerase
MNLPLHHCIRPGIVHFMAFPSTMKGEGPVVETLRHLLNDDYFEVVELSWIKDPAARAEAKALVRASGIDARYGAQPRLLSQKLNLNHADADERGKAVAEIKAAVADAADFGLHDVAFLSGSDVPAAERPAAMDRLEDSLDQICTYAAGHDVRIALEVFDRDIDKKALIGPAGTAREIAERVRAKHANFGLIVDLSHIPLLEETPEQALVPVKDYLSHIHIGNAYFQDRADPAWGDAHPSFGYPGSANDVPQIVAFLKTLCAIGYLKTDGSHRGTVSFEIKPVGSDDPLAGIACAKRKLQEAWAQLTV